MLEAETVRELQHEPADTEPTPEEVDRILWESDALTAAENGLNHAEYLLRIACRPVPQGRPRAASVAAMRVLAEEALRELTAVRIYVFGERADQRQPPQAEAEHGDAEQPDDGLPHKPR